MPAASTVSICVLYHPVPILPCLKQAWILVDLTSRVGVAVGTIGHALSLTVCPAAFSIRRSLCPIGPGWQQIACLLVMSLLFVVYLFVLFCLCTGCLEYAVLLCLVLVFPGCLTLFVGVWLAVGVVVSLGLCLLVCCLECHVFYPVL